MLALVDLDGQRSRKTLQLAGAGVRDNRNAQLRCAPCHRSAVLQDEAARAALQSSRYPLHRDVSPRTLHDGRSRGEHESLAGSLQIAVKLFIDRHSSQARI